MRIRSHNAPRDSIGVWNFLETAEDRKIPSLYDRGLLSPPLLEWGIHSFNFKCQRFHVCYEQRAKPCRCMKNNDILFWKLYFEYCLEARMVCCIKIPLPNSLLKWMMKASICSSGRGKLLRPLSCQPHPAVVYVIRYMFTLPYLKTHCIFMSI